MDHDTDRSATTRSPRGLRRKKRWGAAAAALALTGVGIAVANPAQAHKADDWMPGYREPDSSYQCRRAPNPGRETTPDGHAFGQARICWKNHDVFVNGFAWDAKPDGKYRAVLKLRYKTNDQGTWNTHWHTRTYVEDRGSNDGLTTAKSWSRSRYRTAQVQAQVCSYAGDTKGSCTPWS